MVYNDKTAIGYWLEKQGNMDMKLKPEKGAADKPNSKARRKTATTSSSGERKKNSELRVTMPEDDYLKLRVMHLSRYMISKDALSFGEYVRKLIEQGIKAEPKEIRDKCKELLQ